MVLEVDLSFGVAEQTSNILRDNDASMMAYGAKYALGSHPFAFAVTLGQDQISPYGYIGRLIILT